MLVQASGRTFVPFEELFLFPYLIAKCLGGWDTAVVAYAIFLRIRIDVGMTATQPDTESRKGQTAGSEVWIFITAFLLPHWYHVTGMSSIFSSILDH